MTTLVTGVAGFIGFHTAAALIAQDERVVGIDNLSPYYSVALKRARLEELRRNGNFDFRAVDIADCDALNAALSGLPVRRVIHLAAQAGVRHSLTSPQDYVSANLAGHLNVLEYCRHRDSLEHLVYASSSSVYGGNATLPFRESDRADRPASLYAATKRADEMMSYSYAHLYGLPQTGLRYFTVYGPWGRPDMALWLFAEAILEGRPIMLFDNGRMRRDFTYIDDAVAGTLAVAARPPSGDGPPHRIYNLGAGRPEELTRMISILEEALGRKAERQTMPAQPGDVPATHADISAIRADFGFEPNTQLDVGVPKFVAWLLEWRGRSAG